MTRKKTTVYIDESLLQATKVAAARAGKREYEGFEEVLRRHLGLEASWNASGGASSGVSADRVGRPRRAIA